MSAIIAKLLGSKDALFSEIIVILFAVNSVLTALKMALDAVRTKIDNAFEGKVSAFLGTMLGIFSHVLGFITANKSYLPPDSQAAIPPQAPPPAA